MNVPKEGWDERPICNWKGCNKPAIGAFPDSNPGGWKVFCGEHYKIVRQTGKADIK